jgi:glycerophosphoryl diester phosphodiesterase/membrane-associated phospholipid phosphatase
MVVLLLLAIAASLLQQPPVERIPHFADNVPVNIAHAGAQGHAPGNTILAFEVARDMGAHVLEMDLQLTADDHVVVIHDGTVDRTTDGTGRVRDMTLAEIQALEVGYEHEGPGGDLPFVGQGLRIPTLDEVFTTFPDAWMLIEMKTDGGQEIVAAVADLITAHGRQHNTAVASFDLDYLQEFRALHPDIPTNMPEGEGRQFHILQMLGAHRWWAPPAEFLQVPVDFDGLRVVTPGFVQAAEHRGIDVHVWTINDADEMHWLLNLGAHGIITDYPDRFAEVVHERATAADQRGDPSQHPGLGFVQNVQDRFPGLTTVMSAITWLGDEDFYVLVFPLLFWAVSRRVGLHLAIVFLLSASINAIGKLAFRTPRPSYLDPSLGLRAETTFGVPSGHAQNAVVVWGYLASQIRRRWAWVIAGILMVAIGVSRLQLGVHFPIDTVVGWTLGAVILVAYLRWQQPVGDWIRGLGPRRQVWLGFGASMGLILTAVAVRLAFLGWELPATWIGVDPSHAPMQISSVVTPAATLFGLAAGLVFAANRGGFDSAGTVVQRLARIPIGLLGVAVLYMGLGEIFPRGEDVIALAFRYLRYAAVGMWVAGVAPLLFVRFGLAQPTAVPEAATTSTSAPDSD